MSQVIFPNSWPPPSGIPLEHAYQMFHDNMTWALERLGELPSRVERLEARVANLAELAESLASQTMDYYTGGIVLDPDDDVLPESW
jgi:hypothetical protein